MVSIVIPARNEEQTISLALRSLGSHVTIPYEIIVVDDCSSDATNIVVSKYLARSRNIRLTVTRKGRNGFANALKKGFSLARGEYVVPFMADLCDDPKTINKMYEKTKDGWDVVCGSRYMRGGKKNGGPKLQGFFSKIVNLSLSFLTGIPTKDISNAFKLYKKEILDKITFAPESGVEVSMEILLKAYLKGAKITEVPTRWRGRTKGNSKFRLLERAPRYFRIYLYAFKSIIRKKLGFSPTEL